MSGSLTCSFHTHCGVVAGHMVGASRVTTLSLFQKVKVATAPASDDAAAAPAVSRSAPTHRTGRRPRQLAVGSPFPHAAPASLPLALVESSPPLYTPTTVQTGCSDLRCRLVFRTSRPTAWSKLGRSLRSPLRRRNSTRNDLPASNCDRAGPGIRSPEAHDDDALMAPMGSSRRAHPRPGARQPTRCRWRPPGSCRSR